VGGLVVLADVGLDLDDPGTAPARRIVTDEAGAKQAAAGLERRPREELPEVRQLETKM
jgi:hypothetical protein